MATFTRRQLLSAGALAVPLGLGVRPDDTARTRATAAGLPAENLSAITVVQTTRIGQLSGTTLVDHLSPPDPSHNWPLLVDPVGWPLLTDTGRWSVFGVDEGANTEHSDGRLYIFFGDVATDQSKTNPPLNSDLVAWTDEPTLARHGGHLAEGWTFQLPITSPGIEGQPDWQFCLKCSALFWNGDPTFKGRCPAGDTHDTFHLGLNFSLPFQPTTIAGQVGWRFCGKCAGLFWTDEQGHTGTCPAGGMHDPAGWTFVLPVAPAPTGGQSDWRFCGNCHGLFWDGEASKGLCSGAPGGGFHLRAVLQNQTSENQTQVGPFDPFQAAEPIGYLGSNETPNGAFSFDDTMYVFGGFTEPRFGGRRRPGDPMAGDYLFSKRDPATPGPYTTEFLFAPKLGWCATDEARSAFESHAVLGLHFIVPHDLADTTGRVTDWRCCAKCEALFWDGDPAFKGVCQRGGAHEADPTIPAEFMVDADLPEDEQHQANWHRCRKCLALYWAIDPSDAGRCPASGQHEPAEGMLRVPHPSFEEDAHHQPFWRFCHKCFALFWNGSDTKGVCPKDHGPHEAAGYDFLLPHELPEDATDQTNWQFCGKCNGLFFDGDPAFQGVCPKDGAGHEKVAGAYVFTLPHSLPAETPTQQTRWHYCAKCAGLFFDGYADKGVCPKDGGGHQMAGLEFALTHNPGEDANNRGAFRFCVRCHGLVRTDQPSAAPWVAPTVVDNATHGVLPSHTGQGLVMLTYDGGFFRLLWMPLTPGETPRFDTIRYCHAGKHRAGQDSWSDTPDNSDGYGLFAHPLHSADHPFVYTHVSATWMPGPGLWVLLYSAAWDKINVYDGPINARFSRDLVTWSDDIPLFTPGAPGAYVPFMHDPKRPHPDGIWPNEPTSNPKQEGQGWAYGAFILTRYTTWDAATQQLTLTYLMSPGAPYQVQVMQTTLRLPAAQPQTLLNPVASPAATEPATPGATPVAATPGATPVVATEPPVPETATARPPEQGTASATEVPTAAATTPPTQAPTVTSTP